MTVQTYTILTLMKLNDITFTGHTHFLRMHRKGSYKNYILSFLRQIWIMCFFVHGRTPIFWR